MVNNYVVHGSQEARLECVSAWRCSLLLFRTVSMHFRATKGVSLFFRHFVIILGTIALIDLGFFLKHSWILPGKICQFEFFRFEICLVTSTARTRGNAILLRPLFAIKNHMSNDFISFALPAHWQQHLKLSLEFNFQLISYPIARVLASWSWKTYWFSSPKKLSF